uniref:Uncharacterized protein n=1 Tax=Oryza glumipatula TaxID=40148 RepID=A0A0E0AHX3_9ORYZ
MGPTCQHPSSRPKWRHAPIPLTPVNLDEEWQQRRTPRHHGQTTGWPAADELHVSLPSSSSHLLSDPVLSHESAATSIPITRCLPPAGDKGQVLGGDEHQRGARGQPTTPAPPPTLPPGTRGVQVVDDSNGSGVPAPLTPQLHAAFSVSAIAPANFSADRHT